MAWYRLTVETRTNGCDKQQDFEVPDVELRRAASDEEKEKIVTEYADATLQELVSWGYAPITGPGGEVVDPFGGTL